MSTATQYEPVPCPSGLSPEACEAIDVWGQAWEAWGNEVVRFAEDMVAFVVNPKSPTGVAPPPPPPPPKFPFTIPGRGPGPVR